MGPPRFAALVALAVLSLAELKPATIITDEEMEQLQRGYAGARRRYISDAPPTRAQKTWQDTLASDDGHFVHPNHFLAFQPRSFLEYPGVIGERYGHAMFPASGGAAPQAVLSSQYPVPTKYDIRDPYGTPTHGYQHPFDGFPHGPAPPPPRLPPNLPPPPYMKPKAPIPAAKHHRGEVKPRAKVQERLEVGDARDVLKVREE